MLDRSIAPKFRNVKDVDIQKAETVRLRNGIPLHVINAGSQPVVKLEAIVNSGKWFEPKDGLSFFCTKMLSEGTSSRSSSEISGFFDRYGAFLELNPGFDYNTVSVYALSRSLPVVIDLFREILYESTFPEAEFNLLKKNTISDIKVKNKRNNVVASKKIRELVFGKEHPYGREMTETDILALTDPAELSQFHRHVFLNDFQLICSGQATDELIKRIDDTFGDSPAIVLDTAADFAAPYEASSVAILKESSSQSSIRMAKPLFGKNHPDYTKMLVANEVLGGYFGSRLMKNIREDKGYTYGIYSRLVNFSRAGYFLISTDVKKEFTRQTIDEIKKEIRILQERPPSEAELQLVKNQMIGGFLSEITSPFALADKFKAVHFHNLDYDFYQDFIHTVNTIAPDQIMSLARTYLALEDMTELIVGGE